MTRENYSATGGGTPIDVFPVRAGGTGVTTASAARTALGLVPLGNKDQPSGVAALDANGKLMARYFGPNTPTTIGVIAEDLTPSESLRMPINTTRRYKITNFDSFTTYTVTAVGGSAYIDGDCVVYTTGSTAGTGGFVINGKTYNITVLSSMPVRPVLSTTLAGSTDADSCLTMTTTAFSNKPSGAATHAATNWQVSTDPYFNQKVIGGESTTNKTTWVTYSTLERSKTYYARAQFKDSNGNFGEWSDTVVFTTQAQYWPEKEEARLSASDAVVGSEFGLRSALDGTATRALVAARSNTTSGLVAAGSAYVFLRSGSTWSQEAKLVASDPLAGASFGYSVQLDSTGTRAAVSAPFANNASAVDTGAVYIFLRTGTTWTLETKIVPSDGASGDRFGWDISLTAAGDRMVVSAPAKLGYKGKAYIYVRSGTTWTQEATVVGSDVVAPWTFGSSVEITSTSGDRVVVGCRSASNGSITTGAAYVFLRTGSTWTQEAKVVPSDGTSDSRMGSSVVVTSDGIRFAVGDAAGNEGYTASGKVYVYVRSGTTWTQEAIITPPDSEKDGNFGAVVQGNTALSKLAVGATGAVVNGFPQAGATYIFERGTGWNFIAKKVASPPEYAGRSGFPGDVTNFTRLPIGSADGMVSGIRKGYLSILVNA